MEGTSQNTPEKGKKRTKKGGALLQFLQKHSALLIVLTVDLWISLYALFFFLLKDTAFFFLVASSKCTLHDLHLYCPGCGGTRAVSALLHGQILESLRYNPLPLIWGSLLLFLNGNALLTEWRAKKKGTPLPPYPYRGWVLWAALIGSGLWYLLLLLLLLCGIDLIGDHGSYWRDFFAAL